jgi:hypothetical protein
MRPFAGCAAWHEIRGAVVSRLYRGVWCQDRKRLYSRQKLFNLRAMRKHLLLGVVAALCCIQTVAPAATKTSSPDTRASSKSVPGAEIAQTISMITGVAISPLLGAGAVGAWKYFQAKTPEQKAALPWFAQWWFWMPALLLVALVFAKDVFGNAAPAALKKPFDVAEALENKVSGLVATGAFVPVAAAIFHSPGADTATLSAAGFATVDLHWLYNAIMVLICMIAFVLVWLVGHTINVLILISPFTTVDTALKSARTFLLATVPVTSWINPWLGALWALIIIVISYFLAGWSFRLTMFGTVFVWDFCTFRRRRFSPNKIANWMFLGRALNKVPIRTYGKLARDEQGKLGFTFRPWLVLSKRTLVLPEGKYEAGCGMFYSELLKVEGEDAKTIMLLPPRYRGHEAELVRIHGLDGVRDIGLRRAWRWLKELFGFKGKPQPAPA